MVDWIWSFGRGTRSCGELPRIKRALAITVFLLLQLKLHSYSSSTTTITMNTQPSPPTNPSPPQSVEPPSPTTPSLSSAAVAPEHPSTPPDPLAASVKALLDPSIAQTTSALSAVFLSQAELAGELDRLVLQLQHYLDTTEPPKLRATVVKLAQTSKRLKTVNCKLSEP